MFIGTVKIVITQSDLQPKRRGRTLYSTSGCLTLMANQWGLSLYGKCYIYITNFGTRVGKYQ